MTVLPQILIRIFIETAFAAHLVGAAMYFWMSPKGFPIDHSRFWLNSILPLATIILALVGLAAILLGKNHQASFVSACFAAAWAAASIASRLCFPESLSTIWTLGLIVAAGALLCSRLLAREHRLSARWIVSGIVVSAITGFLAIAALLPPPASTIPLVDSFSPVGTDTVAIPARIEVVDYLMFDPTAAEFLLQRESISLACRPLITFDRVAADGFWSLLGRVPPERQLVQYLVKETLQTFQYSDGAVIQWNSDEVEQQLDISAYTPLSQDIFSHLNSFCVLEIWGHEKLSLGFSPCTETMIDVLPADYPSGRPARFAYLNESERFMVVEATSGEKGPFHTLASGKLRRGDPLSIVFYDRGRPIASVRLEDWTAQLSTDLSPTAGGGVPMNAIEFQRSGEAPNSPANVWITLAATSVGRGWDTVGHRAGIYRNRMIFEKK